jgi:hypothetical protein
MRKAPSEKEVDQMIKSVFEEMEKETGEEKSEDFKACFALGFKFGIVAMTDDQIFKKVSEGKVN